MNHRLELFVSRSLFQCFEQQGDHAGLGVLEIGEEVERLGALPT